MSTVKHSSVLACRVCLTTQYEDRVTMNCENGLLKMFEYCFGLQINPDHRCRTLCKLCKDDMKKFATFKEKCLKSDAIWKLNLLSTSELEIKYLETEKIIAVDSDNEHGLKNDENIESHTEVNEYSDILPETEQSESNNKINYNCEINTRSRNNDSFENFLKNYEKNKTSEKKRVIFNNSEAKVPSRNSVIELEKVLHKKVELKKTNKSNYDKDFEEFLKNYEKNKMKKEKRVLSNTVKKVKTSNNSSLKKGEALQSSALEKELISQKSDSEIDLNNANEADDDISFEEYLKNYEKMKEIDKKKKELKNNSKGKVQPQSNESKNNLSNTNNFNNDIALEVFLNENEEDKKIKESESQIHCELSEKNDTLQNSQKNSTNIIDNICFEDFLKEYKTIKMTREEDALFCKCGSKGYNKRWYASHTKKCRIYKFYKLKAIILHTECGLCKYSAQDVDSLGKHLGGHYERNDLVCQLCDFYGRDFAEMVYHRYSHINTKAKMYCHICRKTFVEPKAFQFHFRSSHMKKKGGLCTYCGEEMKTYKGWVRHELRMHNRDRFGEEQEIFICDCCGLRFAYRTDIVQHLLERDGLTTCVCDTCGASFKRPTSLKSHIRNMHTVQDIVQCPHCPRMIKKYLLKRHITVIHGEKKFVCEVCSASFTTHNSLKYHMNSHSDDRPFQCDFCHARFKSKHILRSHILIHTGLKPHQCKECQKAFRGTVELRRHVMVVHLKIKPFKCGQCDKSFYCKYLVRKHEQKVHHGIPQDAYEVMQT